MQWLTVAGLVVILAMLGRCRNQGGPGPFPQAPVILISIDTLRSDRLPIYGYAGIKTPNLDQFAADSIVFERAYSQSPLTLPSHASLFTGLLPPDHGVRDNSFYEVSQELTTLAERLSAEGFATGGVVSSVILGSRTGIHQGFQFYESDLRDDRGGALSSRSGAESVQIALRWLTGQPEGKANFLFLHLFEPHTPYQPPEPYAGMASNAYDGEIVYTDALLGQFFDGLKALGLYRKSLIVLVSDHGEGLNDHGEAEHGILLYREAIQVPFVMKLPQAVRAGTRVEKPVMLVDIKPTLEKMLGLTPGKGAGKDLFSKDVDWQKRPLFAETRYPFNNFGYPAGQSVIRGDYHFLRYSDEELYQMMADPQERVNLRPSQPVPAPIHGFLEVVGSGSDAKTGESSGDLELLASLGYSAVQVQNAQHLDKPIADLIQAVKVLDEADSLKDKGHIEEAKVALENLLKEQPCLHQARLDLGKILAKERQWPALAKHYEQALLCDSNNLRFLMLTGEMKLRAGMLEDARRLAEQVMAVGTEEAKGEFAYYFHQHGHSADAGQMADLLWKQPGKHPYAGLILGEAQLAAGNSEDALRFLESAEKGFEAGENAEMTARASHLIGECHRASGALEKALSAYEKALQNNPNFPQARAAGALVLAGLGRKRAAIQIMDDWVRDFPSHLSYSTAARTMQAINEPDAAAFFLRQSQKYPSSTRN